MHKTPQFQQRAHQHWEAGRQADKRRRWDTALRAYEKATQLAPRESLYWLSLATAALQQNQMGQAESAARQGLALAPGFMGGQLLANALAAQNRHSEAADVYLGLPESVARTPEFLMRQAESLLLARRYQEAIASYLQSLSQVGHNPLAYQQMGRAFEQIGRPRDAALCLETAAATDSTGSIGVAALSQLVHMLRQSADWNDLERHTRALLRLLDERPADSAAHIEPFSLLSIPTTPQHQHLVGRACSERLTRSFKPLPAHGPRHAGRIRVGYLSADLYSHATAQLISELLELQDRSRFEIFLYCHSPQDGTPMQQRVRAAADHFRDIRHVSDHEAARTMRADKLDIAVDLKGYTKDTRMQILGYRPAPLQLSYLGYPGTTGCDFLDYVVGDAVVTPLTHAAHFSERIAQMPHSYQPNDGRRVLPAKPSRADLGLPDDAVVLCSFNQTYKISPEMADLWAQILREATNTVLWQVNWNDQASASFVREMQRRGVGPERLYFSPAAPTAEHLGRVQCADLMLDTWPCNAHTTASDALWCGVPVLTVPGLTFASRVAASLVSACGLPDMVCADPASYVARAVSLAQDRSALRQAQQHLQSERDRLPLFDAPRYARDFDALLQRMWDRHAQGLAPDHLQACAS